MAVSRIMWTLAALVAVLSLVNCDTEEDVDALADRDAEEDIDALADRDAEEDIDALADRDTEEDMDVDLNERAARKKKVSHPQIYVPGDKGGEGEYASSCTSDGKCSAARKGECDATDHGECYKLTVASIWPYNKPACCCRTWYYNYYPLSFWQWTGNKWVFWKVCSIPAYVLAGRCYTADLGDQCCKHPKCRCRQRWYWVRFYYCTTNVFPQQKKWVWRSVPHHCYCAK